ncbi:Grx4 family monothiol glutaredoxin [Candidatus Profftella armatura]|uniref:Glutaredoxin n=1 Tax=Candidatus Profftella armatura TaxID=669502 RepID=S5RLR2_9PROT|nr:Grx4 family monothiol glutaredoxin [Candidatus Profftella armatura]AGS06861.1 glutaredoxin 4 [Candidatus Profftella armatura]ALC95954.1 glutaredoxin [Candidatus Profftella armatura]QLK13772.1 Grx4 family monothiol glutaredoxin [Candidatus Profftella armatura]
MRKIQKLIKKIITTNRVTLFMKGTEKSPQCGFSEHAIHLLKINKFNDFVIINVLENLEIREGIKKYSNWPTIPQLYINEKFIGGSDIMNEMHISGELKKLLFLN